MSQYAEMDDGSQVMFCDKDGNPVDASKCAYAVLTRPDGFRAILVPPRQVPGGNARDGQSSGENA